MIDAREDQQEITTGEWVRAMTVVVVVVVLVLFALVWVISGFVLDCGCTRGA